MKLLIVLMCLYCSSCLSSGRKGETESSNDNRDSADQFSGMTTSPTSSKLLTECHTIVNGKRHIYSFFRTNANSETGTVSSIDPIDPLGENSYIADYDFNNKIVEVTLNNGDKQSVFKIDYKTFDATLEDVEGNSLSNFTCNKFVY